MGNGVAADVKRFHILILLLDFRIPSPNPRRTNQFSVLPFVCSVVSRLKFFYQETRQLGIGLNFVVSPLHPSPFTQFVFESRRLLQTVRPHEFPSRPPGLFAALLIASGTGCQKNESAAPPAPPTVLSPDTVASVHWFGKKRVGITFGAYFFSRVWQQPQSAQLERQTLIKLASAPGLWLPGSTTSTPTPVPGSGGC